MSLNNYRLLKCNARHNERGQVLPIVALWMVFLLGMAALSVDLGNAYLSYRQLQAATDAAALAGASALSVAGATTTSVKAAATQYSASDRKFKLPSQSAKRFDAHRVS